MPKHILILAMVLASASTQAAGTRSLSAGRVESSVAAAPAVTSTSDRVAEPAPETPRYVERPSAKPAPPAATTPVLAARRDGNGAGQGSSQTTSGRRILGARVCYLTLHSQCLV